MPARKALILIAVFLFLVSGLIWIPNHLNFRTYGLDLGLYTHVAYDYAHFRLDDCLLFLEDAKPALADHFDLHLLLWSPLTFLFGTWTLPIVQWFAAVLGLIGTWRFLRSMWNEATALVGAAVFATSWGLYSAFAFDFHSSVVASFALPWFFYWVRKSDMIHAWASLLFILIAKENLGFWMCFVCIGALFIFGGGFKRRRMLLLMSLFSFLYSLVIVGWVMPDLTPDGTFAHFDYPLLGDGIGSAFKTLFTNPLTVISGFFLDSSGLNTVKVEAWVVFLLAGGWACLLRPQYLVMILPVIAFKMLSDKEVLWSLIGHYSIEFVPIMALAIAHVWYDLGQRKVIALVSVALSIACTIHVMDGTGFYEDRARIRFYQAKHYTRPFNLDDCRAALNLIPEDAAVSAQSSFIPHLALRKNIRQFPLKGTAEFVILNPMDRFYPLDDAQYNMELAALKRSKDWDLLFSKPSAMVFQRKP